MTACSRSDPELITKVEVSKINIPAEMFECEPAPSPVEGGDTLRDVTLYAIDVMHAGQDCRDKLEAVKEFVK